jgi:hypothetical protein
MVKSIVGVVVGYLSMAVFVFVTFSITYLAMGADSAFQAGSYDVSTLWIVVSFVLSVVAAAVGGFVCAAIAKNMTACYVLAGIVLVLGLLMAIPVLTSGYEGMPEVRDGSVGNFEAMQYARQPAWIALLNPPVESFSVAG